MFAGLEPDKYHQLVGACHAYEVALKLPDTIDQHARQIDEHRSNADARNDAAKQRSDLAFAGSHWFARRG
jgi:hypothetical protein